MTLQLCPYCNLEGLVTTVRMHGEGLDIMGRCITCGYSYDSDFAPAEIAEDLPSEFTNPLEVIAAD